jgi:hypothetical protein
MLRTNEVLAFKCHTRGSGVSRFSVIPAAVPERPDRISHQRIENIYVLRTPKIGRAELQLSPADPG